jgi:hypothetical protein
MLKLNDGHWDDSWKDLIAAHRLARLVGQHPTVIGFLWSLRSENEVCIAERQFFLHADLSLRQLQRMTTDLGSIPPFPDITEKHDRADRWTYLDSVRRVATGGLTTLQYLNAISQVPLNPIPDSGLIYVNYIENVTQRTPQSPYADLALQLVDWNHLLREGNQWYDRVVSVARQPAGPQRMRAVQVLVDEHRHIRGLAYPDETFVLYLNVAQGRDFAEGVIAAIKAQPAAMIYALLYRPHTRRHVTWQFNHICRALLTSSGSESTEADDYTKSQVRITRLVGALALYRKNHEAYPRRLSELPGMDVKHLNRDPYSGKEFQYRRTAGQFVLSSAAAKVERFVPRRREDFIVRSRELN